MNKDLIISFFPIYMIIGNIGACIVYCIYGEWVKLWYWSAALQLNICVYLMK